MKTGFKDALAVKKEDPKPANEKGNELAWSYKQPDYDKRSSCFVNAGTHYGVGHTQPVGSSSYKAPSPIPFGRINTMRIDG
jgi:hypothetical protein